MWAEVSCFFGEGGCEEERGSEGRGLRVEAEDEISKLK
jgi:hypothetical protein